MTRHVENESAPFAMVPEPLLYDTNISAQAVRVYGVLRRYGSDPGNCYPSHQKIAEHIGQKARSVPAWIRELEEAGWVDRVPRWRDGEAISTDSAMAGQKGWEPTSNGYFVRLHRATQRGVRADEQGPLRAEQQGGCAPENAPKESNTNESQVERETTDKLTLVVDPVIGELCDYLALRIARHRGDETTRPKIGHVWHKDMRLLMERGPVDVEPAQGVKPEQIRAGIDFLFDELNVATEGRRPFCWANVIQSPNKLRAHWTSLRAAARQKNIGRVNPNTRNVMQAAMRASDTSSDAAKLFKGELGEPIKEMN